MLKFLGPTRVPKPTASRSVQPFLHSSRQSIPIFPNGPHFPSQNCPFPQGIWTHLIYGSLWPPVSSTQVASGSAELFSQGSLLWQSDRLTERPTDHSVRSVTVGHIYEHSMPCSLKIGKAHDIDGVMAEHVFNCHRSICLHLQTSFNAL